MTVSTTTSRPTSLSDSGVQLSPDEGLNSHDLLLSTTSSSLAEGDETTRAKTRMEKYFAEKPDKNIFMKLIHPSYHERNLQFKKIFVEKGLIDENDQFLASYSCAYQREILAQGRMFISQFNVCFYANIIGWETTLVIPMREIKLIKKMKAAFIFPNSIQFERDNGEKYFFASFVNRDKSFQVLTTAHEKAAADSRAMTREEVWDMVYNSEEKNPSPQNSDAQSPASPKNTSTENMTVLSTRSFNGSLSRTEASTMKNGEKDNASQSSTSTSSDFQEEDATSAPFSSEPFEDLVDDGVYEEVRCPCTEHLGRLIMDKEFNISVEKFYELTFTETPFFAEYNEKTRVAEYVAATWVRDHRGENTRTCTYTVGLSHAMAPKAIIVNEKQVLKRFPNPKHGLMITKETQNSGVPYAEHFTVHCYYCISRTGPNSCRVKVHGDIVYKKSVWTVVKGFIEKGTHNGLLEHFQLLEAMLDDYCLKHSVSEQRTSSTTSLTELKNGEGTITNEIRQRRPESSAERLMAGGEAKSTTNSENDLVAEMRPRVVADVSEAAKPTAVQTSADYKPFLTAIIVLLASFFIINVYILQSVRNEPVPVATKKEEDLSALLSALMDQVRELKDKVDRLQKSE